MKKKNLYKYLFLFVFLIMSVSLLSNCKKECNHLNVSKSIVLQPTCTSDGKIKITCNKCEEVFEETISALGHDYIWTTKIEPTCYSKGFATAICRRNKDHQNEKILEKVSHLYTNYVSNNDATLTKEGTKTANCDYKCGNTDTIIDEGSMFNDFKNDTFFVEGLKETLKENYTFKIDDVCLVEQRSLMEYKSSELFLTIKDDQLFGYGKGTRYESFQSTGPLKNFVSQYYVISNGYFYLVEVSNDINNTIIKYSLDDIFVQGSQLEEFFDNIYKDSIKYLETFTNIIDENPKFYNTLLKNLVSELCNVYKIGSTYNFRLNNFYVERFNNRLKTESFENILDQFLGENSVNRLHNEVNNLLQSDAFNYINLNSYQLNNILDELDEFISFISSNQYQSLEDLIFELFNIRFVDLNNILNNENKENYKVIDLLADALNINKSLIQSYIDEMLISLKTYSFYEFLHIYFNNDSFDFYSKINQYSDVLLTADSKGKMLSLQFDENGLSVSKQYQVLIGYDENYDYEEIILLTDIINNISIDYDAFVKAGYQLIYEGEKLVKVIEESVVYENYSNALLQEDYYIMNADKITTTTTYIFLSDKQSIKYDYLENTFYLISSMKYVDIQTDYVLVKYNEEKGIFDEQYILTKSNQSFNEYLSEIKILN